MALWSVFGGPGLARRPPLPDLLPPVMPEACAQLWIKLWGKLLGLFSYSHGRTY